MGALAVFHPGGMRQRLQRSEHDPGRELGLANRGGDFALQSAGDGRDFWLGRGRRCLYSDAFCRARVLDFLFGNRGGYLPVWPTINPSAFALVGMGAFLAATTHAPIMAIIMIFELTLDYQIILPLMLACVVGYYTSFSFEKRSIYSEALKRKGAGDYRHQLAELHVRDLMKPDPLTVRRPRALPRSARNLSRTGSTIFT